MKDEFEYKFEILMKELDTLQSSIRAYDTILYTIKGWAITVVSALLLFTLEQKQAIYIAFCIGAVFLFWMLDVLNKWFQVRFIFRNNQVEAYLRSNLFSDAIKLRSFDKFTLPNTFISHRELSGTKYSSPLRLLFYLNVSLLYLLMLIVILLVGIWMTGMFGS